MSYLDLQMIFGMLFCSLYLIAHWDFHRDFRKAILSPALPNNKEELWARHRKIEARLSKIDLNWYQNVLFLLMVSLLCTRWLALSEAGRQMPGILAILTFALIGRCFLAASILLGSRILYMFNYSLFFHQLKRAHQRKLAGLKTDTVADRTRGQFLACQDWVLSEIKCCFYVNLVFCLPAIFFGWLLSKTGVF